MQCRDKSYHQLIIICRLQHEESLSLNDIVHHNVKYHSLFFTNHRPQFNQTIKPTEIVSRRKHNRIIVLGFGAGQTANRLFGVVSAIVVSMILDIPIACMSLSTNHH